MADTKTPLLQKATVVAGSTAQELDLSFCLEVSFIETMDLSGPRLILKFNDIYSILRNVLKIKPGSKIVCILQDLMHENAMNYTDTFYVMSLPVDGDIVTLNCLSAGINQLKIPAVKTKLIPQTSLYDTVRQISPGFSGYDIATGVSLNPYHLLTGERPSTVLRQVARENGCFCYIDRGTLCFNRYEDVFDRQTLACFCYKDPLAPFRIVDYRHINNEQMFRDVALRRFCGFSVVDGFIINQNAENFPYEMTSLDQLILMQNEMKLSAPTLDVITWGAGHLRPGQAIQFRWNLDAAWHGAPYDESLPTKAIVGAVAHHSSGATNYFCRVKAVLKLKNK